MDCRAIVIVFALHEKESEIGGKMSGNVRPSVPHATTIYQMAIGRRGRGDAVILQQEKYSALPGRLVLKLDYTLPFSKLMRLLKGLTKFNSYAENRIFARF